MLVLRLCERVAGAVLVVIVHGARARRGSSGEQNRIQPRQTDDVSGLLEMDVVRKEWGDELEGPRGG